MERVLRVAKSFREAAEIDQLEHFAHVDPDGESSFADGELVTLFKDSFDILHDEVIETTPDWKKDRAKVERFVARKR